MGIKILRVPPDWEHPKPNSEYISLLDNFSRDLFLWEQGKADWAKGICNCSESIPLQFKDYSWEDFAEPCPDPRDYMPVWADSDCTHFQIYSVTDGVPISQIFATKNGLIEWLEINQFDVLGKVVGDKSFIANAIKTDAFKYIEIEVE